MKGKKYIVPLLLAGATATGYVTNITQNISVNAATEELTNVVGKEIKLSPFDQDTYEIGDPVYLPVPEGYTLTGNHETEKVKYTVTKGGKSISNEDLEFDSTKNQYYFEAELWGYYNIDVAIEEAGFLTSKVEDLAVFVTSADATINLPVNSSRVIPAKVATNQANFEIPAPTVTIDDEEKNAQELGTQLVVTLVDPTDEEGHALTLKSEQVGDNTQYFYQVDPSLLGTPGTYQIIYTYYNEEGKYVSSLDTNFQVVKNYDASKINLTMTFLDELDTTGNVNSDISVPRVKVTESASSLDSINAQVIVTVKNVKKNEVVKFNEKDYTFKPSEPGFYTVTYQAKIPMFGLATKEITLDTTMEVEDKEAPVVIPTYEYELTNGAVTKVNGTDVAATSDKTAKEVAEEMLVNRSVEIPAVAIKGQEFDIPAAYATDNYYQFKGEGTDDIVITRTYKDGSAVATVTAPANKKGTVKFNETGKNEIRYRAKDKAGNDLGEIVYTVQVYESLKDLKDGETKINLNVGTDVVTYREDKLSFAKPSAKDTYDDNVEVRTFYVVETNKGDKSAVELKETTKDGKYEISIEEDILKHEEIDTDVPANSTYVTGIRIWSEAYVDTTLETTAETDKRTNGQLHGTNKVVSEDHEITFIGRNYDKEIPTFSLASAGEWKTQLFTENYDAKPELSKIAVVPGTTIAGIDDAGNALDGSDQKIKIGDSTDLFYAPFDQGEKTITLPGVKFADSDSHLSTSVSIQNINGSSVNDVAIAGAYDTDKNKVGNNYEYIISGVKVKLSYAGLYVVTFRAEDIVGNVTVQSYGFKVNDKTAPTIIIDDADEFGKDIEVGEEFKVPTPTLVKNGETIKGDVEWEIYKTSGSAKYTTTPNGFTPRSEGTFFIRYYGTDETLNEALLEDSTFVITAKDTEAPEIRVATIPATRAWNPAEGEKYVKVSIPAAQASDILTQKDCEVVCTVTTPSGTKVTPTVSTADPTKLTFNATSEGIYTVKYYAVDEAGNEKTHTATISVGDCVKPQLSWKEELETTATLGSEFSLNMNNIVLDDFGETDEETLRKKLDITMTGPDQTKLTNLVTDGTGYKWKLNQAGSYVLKFTLKDDANNTNTYTYSITVPEEEVETETVNPAVGIVLVVLSVVVLSGVVIYFVVSSKKKSVKTSKKSK